MVQADKRGVVVLTHNTHVSVTVHNAYLLLEITGAEDAFAQIIEQVCWVVSVTGQRSISLLEKYAKETNGGKKTRGYSETLHAGKPIITAGTDGRFKVSFSPSRTEIHENHGVVARTGNCWKTMAGLSIVASGYTIPKRPKQGSGLEAPLSVLRQLFKRGCPGKRVVPLDKPMVMIPTAVGKDHEAYQLRLLMAVGAQQCTHGNAIYWHFHPATFCNSLGSCEQIEKEIGVSPSVVNPQSRHFVGWSGKAGFLAGKQPNNSWGGRLDWPPCLSEGQPHAVAAYLQVPAAPKLEAGSLTSSHLASTSLARASYRAAPSRHHPTYPFLNPLHRSLSLLQQPYFPSAPPDYLPY